jgi:hypothetical protein
MSTEKEISESRQIVEAVPITLDQHTETIEHEGHLYQFDAIAPRPYTFLKLTEDRNRFVTVSETSSVDSPASQIIVQQSETRVFSGTVASIIQAPDKTQFTIFGTTIPHHALLAGSLAEAGFGREQLIDVFHDGVPIGVTLPNGKESSIGVVMSLFYIANAVTGYQFRVYEPIVRKCTEASQNTDTLAQVDNTVYDLLHIIDMAMPSLASRITGGAVPFHFGDDVHYHRLQTVYSKR